MPQHGLSQKRDVANPTHISFVDGKAFRPPEFAVDKRRVKLQSEAIVNSVTDDELRDRTFQSLSGGIGNLTIVELKRAEMGELLGDSGVEPAHGNFLLRHRFQLRGVAAAEIASVGSQRKKRQREKKQPQQHRACFYSGWQIASTRPLLQKMDA